MPVLSHSTVFTLGGKTAVGDVVLELFGIAATLTATDDGAAHGAVV